MRRSLISVAGANSRAGKAQISVAGDLLASLNPVNLQQKVNESQRGVGLSSLRGVENAEVFHDKRNLKSSLRGDKIAEAIHYATKSRFEDTNLRIKNATKSRSGLLRYARNDGVEGEAFMATPRNDEFGANSAFGKFDEMAKANSGQSMDLRLRESVLRTDATASRGALARNDEFPQNRQGSLNSASNVLKNTQNRQDSLNTPNNLNSLNSLNFKTPPPQWF